MRVLMVNAHGYGDARGGGVENGIARLSGELVDRGHAVAHLNAFPGGRAAAGTEVTVLHATDWRDDSIRRLRSHAGDVTARPTRKLAEAVARYRPDVVHTHNLPGISTAVWEVARRLGLPVMHTLHDYHLFCPRVTMMHRDGTTPCRPHPLLCGLRTRRLLRWAGAVSYLGAVSAYLLELFAPSFPAAERGVLRNPMLLPEDAGTVRPPARRLGSIGYIGGLDPIKGVSLLLSAAPVLAELGCELHIAGGGRLASEVEAAARRSPLIHFHGVVSGPEKHAFFESCDAGIIPSIWAEPGGPTHVLVEWLGAGRPVIVSGRGGLGEVIDRYPSAIRLEPTVEGVEATLRELAEPATWETVRGRIGPLETEGELDDWVAAHEQIYARIAVGAGRRSGGSDGSQAADPARDGSTDAPR